MSNLEAEPTELVCDGQPDAGIQVLEPREVPLGGPRAMSMRDVLSFVLEATGRRRMMVDLPDRLVEFQARMGEKLPTPPLTRDQLILLRRDNLVAEGALTLADLGIAAKAVEAIVPAYLARFRPGGSRRAAA